MRRAPPPMARFGILIHGLRKQMSFSWINRKSLPATWHSQTKCFFNSVGVGFSYADHGETIETTEEAAKNVYAFISIFFETFKGFSGRPFHLSGESYGVRFFLVSSIKSLTLFFRVDIYQCLQAR